MLARADLLAGRGEEARWRLEPLRERAERFHAHDVLIEILTLLTLAHNHTGAHEEALTSLARAVQIGDPEGYVHTILDEGEPICVLLDLLRARGEGLAAAGASRLLAHLSGTEAHSQTGEPLTPREHQVLVLVAAGYSNLDIAQALYLTVGTIKAHMSSIHSKLGAQRRSQAVAYARELGLLGEPPIFGSRR